MKLINFFLKISILLTIFQILFTSIFVPKSQELSRSLMKDSNIDFLKALLNQKNLIILCSLSIFLVSTYLIFLNFYNESGYWYDEWCTLLSSDPNVGLKIIKERHAGNFEKPYENVPIIYYLVLRFFF